MNRTIKLPLLAAVFLTLAPAAFCDDWGTYINRGNEEQDKGDLESAIADFTKAIELEPHFETAYFKRGNAKQAKGDLDGAIADFTKAIENRPGDAVDYFYRGCAKKAKGDFDGAKEDFAKAKNLKIVDGQIPKVPTLAELRKGAKIELIKNLPPGKLELPPGVEELHAPKTELRTAKTTEEEKAWQQIDSLNKQSLQDFLKRFPDGKNAQEAKLAVSLQDKFASVRAEPSKAVVTIPFDALGQTWVSWKQRRPDKSFVGYFVKKSDNNSAMLGVFWPLTGGSTAGARISSFDDQGVLVSPTGDGSIIAFRTDGMKYKFCVGVIIQGIADEPIYFGVLQGTGLVHLSGPGKVTLPDGKVFDLQ